MMKIAGVGVCVLSLFVGCGEPPQSVVSQPHTCNLPAVKPVASLNEDSVPVSACDERTNTELANSEACPDGFFLRRPLTITTTIASLRDTMMEATEVWNGLLGVDVFVFNGETNSVNVRYASERTERLWAEQGNKVGGSGVSLNEETCSIEGGVVLVHREHEHAPHSLNIQVHELGHLLGMKHDNSVANVMTGSLSGCLAPSQEQVETLRQNIAF